MNKWFLNSTGTSLEHKAVSFLQPVTGGNTLASVTPRGPTLEWGASKNLSPQQRQPGSPLYSSTAAASTLQWHKSNERFCGESAGLSVPWERKMCFWKKKNNNCIIISVAVCVSGLVFWTRLGVGSVRDSTHWWCGEGAGCLWRLSH